MLSNNELMMTGSPSQVPQILEALKTMQDNMALYPNSDPKMMSGKEIAAYANEHLISNIYTDTALLLISGTLVPSYTWMEQYAPIVSYDSIRAAIDTLMDDDEITKVIVVIESPGGYARGCGVTADMLYALGEAKKLSACFTETTMDSAGYWLGSSLPLVVASKYALVGSVGAYISFSTRFRMMEEAGIDSFVARSGKKKGIPSGVEPLSDIDKEVVNARNQEQAELFLDAVRKGRAGKLKTEEWHSGESFSASKAKELGLVDDISSLADLVNVFKNIEFN